MLQKKLQELESELADVFRLPLDSNHSHQTPFDDIKQRLSFLSKLLSAEVESQPQTSEQLQEIGQRLTELKDAFCDWNESRTCDFNNHDDTLSICSDCNQALLYDDVVESGSPTREAEDFSSEKPPEKFLDSMEKDENEEAAEEEERVWSKMGKYCGVFGCGMIAGAICVVVKLFSSSDHLIEYEAFLLPPT